MNNTLKKMPHNIEAEAAVLGSLLIDNEVANEVIPSLTDEHFISSANRTIFNSMVDLQAQNKPIDILSVSDYLEKQGKFQDVGGMPYLAKLNTEVLSSANIDYYIDIIERDCQSRKMIKIGNEIVKIGYDGGNDKDSLEIAQQKIYSLATKKNSGGLNHIAEYAAKYMADIEDCQRGEKQEDRVLSGFQNLDSIIYGFKASTYTVIAARPSVGKTAFALSLAANAAIEQKKKVAVFNMEMSADEVTSRIMTNHSSVPFSAQKKAGGMQPSQGIELTEAYVKLINSNLYIDDSSDNSPASIMSKCRKLATKNGLDIVIIDYLQLMTTGGKVESRQQEVSTMSRIMKIFSKELNIPVIVLCQLNRGGELRGGKPELYDLRESGSIEQDADIVMFLQRYKPGKGEAIKYTNKNVIELYIEKHRNGQCGKVAFEFIGDKQQFKPIAAVE